MVAMSDLQQTLVSAIQAQERGEIDEAVRLFKASLEIHPGHPAACYSLGVIALRREDHAEAMHWANTGIAAAPGYAPLHFLAGSAVRTAGGAAETALVHFDQAIALQPDYLEALVNSGVALRDLIRHH